MNAREIENLKNSMTVSVFASLPTAWPEYILHAGGKVLLRVSINCNKQLPDGSFEQDVVARAVVFMRNDEIEQPFGMTGLRRLTIRERNLELHPEDIKEYLSGEAEPYMLPLWREVRNNYWRCLDDIMALEPVDLHDPLRALAGGPR